MKLTTKQAKTRKELLYKSTSAEKSACAILDKLGISYIRQFPIKTPRKQFYADIYIPKFRLVLEIDGAYHYTDNQTRLDNNRSACIRRLGYHLYRLSNKEARNSRHILAILKELAYRGIM